jgi:hypothetical protein
MGTIPQRKVTIVPRVNSEDARDAVELGGTFRVFRREKVKGWQNT